ncbi:cation:proton antiporter [Bacillus sp. HMF5848]|uniref:cation:proton antiporter n=1 Tax=Bacillus sp. HMF5848 TaxID=2495421 RepID=UPI000F78FF51|nr:monovalent cation/H(+) antiporter subunit G [Bacillus sp. HMF5848]RSK25824.1 cation:proton antiporter [Bacillus sp. HMF5848]
MIHLIDMLSQIFVYICFITGFYFLVSTTVGMIRLPDLYTRLHISSKCLMAGGISILVGCIVQEGIGSISFKLFVIIIFLFITLPVATHVIANVPNNYEETPIPKNDIGE